MPTTKCVKKAQAYRSWGYSGTRGWESSSQPCKNHQSCKYTATQEIGEGLKRVHTKCTLKPFPPWKPCPKMCKCIHGKIWHQQKKVSLGIGNLPRRTAEGKRRRRYGLGKTTACPPRRSSSRHQTKRNGNNPFQNTPVTQRNARHVVNVRRNMNVNKPTTNEPNQPASKRHRRMSPTMG